MSERIRRAVQTQMLLHRAQLVPRIAEAIKTIRLNESGVAKPAKNAGIKEVAMWYVIQVFTGKEEQIAANCRKIIREREEKNSTLKKCFIPYAIRKKKYGGKWHEEKRVLFPGYVFLVSDEPEDLFIQLKTVPGLTKLLGTGQDIVPLSSAEEAFLKRIGGEDQIIENSIGIIERDRIIVTNGPLLGMEGQIKKIDRHKRIAWLEVEMMGRTLEVQVGLEVGEKR